MLPLFSFEIDEIDQGLALESKPRPAVKRCWRFYRPHLPATPPSFAPSSGRSLGEEGMHLLVDLITEAPHRLQVIVTHGTDCGIKGAKATHPVNRVQEA